MANRYSRVIAFHAVFIFTIASSMTASAGQIFFSTSNTLNGTVTVGNPTINFPSPTGSGTLYIWVTDSTPVTPPPSPNPSVAAFAVQIAKSGSSANITGAQALNFNFHSTLAASGTDLGPTLRNRWDVVSVNPVDGNLNAVVLATVTQAGAGTPGFNPLNDGLHLNPGSATNGTLDTGYDSVAHAFLHGQLTFNITSAGTTQINLQPSSLKIIAGDTDLTFQFTYGFATINVVPEPATIILLAIGTIGLLFARQWPISAGKKQL